MSTNHVLVAGASGLVGYAACRRFAELGWRVTGVSRRLPAGLDQVEMISVDLTVPVACERVFGQMRDVTHVVYAAVQEQPGLFAGWLEQENIERNGAMCRNLFEPLLGTASGLRHVSLLHGTKAYGVHHPGVGPRGVKNPLREREGRAEHPNFYFLQEDYLLDKQRAGTGWGMTVFRPTVIYGDAWGNNMNPIPPLAAYAALLREGGEPLHFPGRAGVPVLREAVDVDLVANALAWATTSESARGGTYNLTNGDVFLWENVWPAIAEEFGMQVGEQRPVSLSQWLPERAQDWAALVAKHDLAAPADIVAFAGANSLVYTDMLLAGGREPSTPILNSTIAARQAGFADCMDSEDMFRKWMRRVHELRLVPPRH